MSLADEGTAVRIASCSRCAKGAEQPLAESTCSRVYRCSKVSRTRASSSCSDKANQVLADEFDLEARGVGEVLVERATRAAQRGLSDAAGGDGQATQRDPPVRGQAEQMHSDREARRGDKEVGGVRGRNAAGAVRGHEEVAQLRVRMDVRQRLAQKRGEGDCRELAHAVNLLRHLLAQLARHALAKAGQRRTELEPLIRCMQGRRKGRRCGCVASGREREAQQRHCSRHRRLAHPAADIAAVIHLVIGKGGQHSFNEAHVEARREAAHRALHCVRPEAERLRHLDHGPDCVASRLGLRCGKCAYGERVAATQGRVGVLAERAGIPRHKERKLGRRRAAVGRAAIGCAAVGRIRRGAVGRTAVGRRPYTKVGACNCPDCRYRG
eukprot:scaffold67005_cov28-Tisochrysis_lutea.AAC.6